MIQYIIRRLLWGVVLLVAVMAITFVLLLPAAERRSGGAARGPQLLARRSSMRSPRTSGTDKPVYTQFWNYLKNLVLHFDLGYSYYSGASVKSLIIDRLPATLSLTVGAVVIWLADRHPGRDHLGDQAPQPARPSGDGHLARVRLDAGVLARAARPVRFASDIGKFPIPFLQAPAHTSASPSTRCTGSSR